MAKNRIQISIEKAVTLKNDLTAADIRRLLTINQAFCLNIIAAPGAGKTSLVEETIKGIGGDFRILVIEGDPHTSIDRDRVLAIGAESFQINTMGGCHLDARMVMDALEGRNLAEIDLLIIENIGNLLCPAAWDLGEDVRAVVASLPEGADKPLKYPETFILSQVLIINKIDLEPCLLTKAADIRREALLVNPSLEVFEVSCLKGTGLDVWSDWLKNRISEKQQSVKIKN